MTSMIQTSSTLFLNISSCQLSLTPVDEMMLHSNNQLIDLISIFNGSMNHLFACALIENHRFHLFQKQN